MCVSVCTSAMFGLVMTACMASSQASLVRRSFMRAHTLLHHKDQRLRHPPSDQTPWAHLGLDVSHHGFFSVNEGQKASVVSYRPPRASCASGQSLSASL
jgi:hypothetical protein